MLDDDGMGLSANWRVLGLYDDVVAKSPSLGQCPTQRCFRASPVVALRSVEKGYPVFIRNVDDTGRLGNIIGAQCIRRNAAPNQTIAPEGHARDIQVRIRDAIGFHYGFRGG